MTIGLLFLDIGRGYPKVVITQGPVKVPLGARAIKWVACFSIEEARSRLFTERRKIKLERRRGKWG